MIAKVRLLEKEELQPGETAWVQLSLSKAVALVNGDHFIIRSPVETLGGGETVEAHPKRYRRFRPAIIQSLRVREEGTAEEIVTALLEVKQPVALPDLLAQCNLSASEVQMATESLIQQKKIVAVGPKEHCLLLTRPGWERLTKKATALVQDYHHRFPARLGIPRVELSSKLKWGAHSSAILQRLLDEGVFIEEGLVVRLPTYQIQLTPAQQTKIDAFLDSLAQNPYAPPSDQIPEPDLLNLLIERHQVVKVDNNVVFSTATYNEMVARVIAHIKAQGKVTLAEVRDMFNTSRKYALAFLEHLDGKKITRRIGDERVLH
jgi:selenocysteine-specific elongation factor